MYAPTFEQNGEGGCKQVKEKECQGCCTPNQIGIFIEQKKPKTRPVSPVVSPRSPVNPTSLPLVSTPPPVISTPSPILPPSSPVPSTTPTVTPPSPMILIPPSPLILTPSLPVLSPQTPVILVPFSISGVSDSSVTSKTPPTNTDAVLAITEIIQQLDVYNDPSTSDHIHICSISHKADPAWLIDLRKQQDACLVPMDIQLNSFNRELDLVQNHIKQVAGEIELAEHDTEMAEEQIKSAEERMRLAEEEIKSAGHAMELAGDRRKNAEAAKIGYEEQSKEIGRKIDQAQRQRDQTNQYWLDLINEHLRQHSVDRHR
ncbi:unnamed protein product [Rotaria magnacalcarata]|uniref:Uncharacterized protein n=1 Tax=Rotaria magnacalcarata TaxID=392030 RepID=A0A816TVE2_9BILA|nr:unnamed protein product [Rotaria magnacalcarata]